MIKDIINNFFNKKSKQSELPDDPIHYCCMCGAPETDVNLIIRGGGNNYICDRCASMIHYQMDELYKYANELKSAEQSTSESTLNIPTPHEIKDYLDQYVIGQDDAKIKLAVAVYNHYKRIAQTTEDDIDIEKSNILLVGPSGSGKTFLAKTIAKMLDVPFAICDSTSITESGYVGEDVESILTKLLQNADYDIKKTERGIVFIDEIDKIAKKSDSPSITRDVSGEGVQQGILKLLEGSKVSVSPKGGRKHPEKEMVEIDTKNILFICGGAFVGIERKIGNRLNMQAIGFSTNSKKKIDKNNLMKYLIAEDIQSYGIIPELIGRLPVITTLESLDKVALRKILIEPKNAIIKQYIKLFEMDNVKLSFEDDVLDYIVDKAISMNLGARGLRSIVEEIMTKYMYDMPSLHKKRLKITRAYAEEIFNNKINI